MEKMGEWEQRNLIKELAQGRELARKLQMHLSNSSSSQEVAEPLAQKILDSYEKALSLIGCNSSVADTHLTRLGIQLSESPLSLDGSPRSEDSDRDFEDPNHKIASRKRNSLPIWIQKVRVKPGMALERPLDDGFSWRKYGLKDILNAKHPRGYYRCTHKNIKDCMATKQVQRSDEDPNILEITYRGLHTCTQLPNTNSPSAQPQTQEPNTPLILQSHPTDQENQHFSQSMNLNNHSPSCLKIITENLDLDCCEQSFPQFQMGSTSGTKPENHMNSASVGGNIYAAEECCPSFMWDPTSGMNYSSGLDGFLGKQRMQGSNESELAGIFSAATSTDNSPTVGMEFPFDQTGFDPNFPFDNHGFFP